MNTNTENKEKKSIYAVLFGGRGCEHDISLLSAESFICAARDAGFELLLVYIDRQGDFYIFKGNERDISKGISKDLLSPTFPIRMFGKRGFLCNGEIIEPKLCVPVLHGDYGEDGKIQGLLEIAGIPYVGCDTVSGAVCADKAFAKAVARSAGVPVLKDCVYRSGAEDEKSFICRTENNIGYPVFIKPCRLGSSVGASVVYRKEEFAEALKNALCHSERIMAEPALLGKRELECAYFSIDKKVVITFPGETVCKSEFYDFDAKYKSDDTKVFPVAEIDAQIKQRIVSYTKKLAYALDIRHMSRFDYFLSAEGDIYFNEVNTFPGMTKSSLYSSMLNSFGIDFSSFVEALLSGGA